MAIPHTYARYTRELQHFRPSQVENTRDSCTHRTHARTVRKSAHSGRHNARTESSSTVAGRAPRGKRHYKYVCPSMCTPKQLRCADAEMIIICVGLGARCLVVKRACAIDVTLRIARVVHAHSTHAQGYAHFAQITRTTL